MSRKQKPKLWVIKVTGRGRFPMDMLRHDCAWPLNTADAMAITETIAADPAFVSVRLMCSAEPTTARWLSFGWGCEITEVIRP